jgi:1-acyl-sn-glycerol-3-phosphate acyltransferase
MGQISCNLLFCEELCRTAGVLSCIWKEEFLKNRPLYAVSRTLVRTFAAVMLRMEIRHQRPLPPGPKIFVANHPSATDPFLIHLVSGEETNVMITESAFRVRFFGSFLRRVREIPVPLTLTGGVTAVEQAGAHLKQGASVAIFIEGLISPREGGFLPPRAGAARLALAAGVPVVPVGIYLRVNWRLNIRSGISGSQTEAYWYFHGPYIVTVGKPMVFHDYPHTNKSVRLITEQIMAAVRYLAAESEQRGKGIMRSSPLITFARWIMPLFRNPSTPM